MAELKRVNRDALLPYTAAQVYAIVNDVESYPQFLPWCSGSAILDSRADQMTARVDVEKGGLRQSFTTRNDLVPNRSIALKLVDGPFSRLRGRWRFDELGDEGCKVSLDLSFSFANRLVASTFGAVFGVAANQMLDAFCKRADALHGG
tara:strand:+ start:498 stop:941 length:444 start_codon:yes stop_codon:yes gene_type:complete